MSAMTRDNQTKRTQMRISEDMTKDELLVGDTASKELMLATLDRLVEGKVVARRAVNAIRKLIEQSPVVQMDNMDKPDSDTPVEVDEKST